ncbi:hypothetical protein MTP04_02200 [Lysinibacillus sp. PLM2]|nr:hypothetical protein MTP04_02200 [Lysinibacillus sp. PLM2]
MSEFGEYIKKVRDDKGMTLGQLATYSGISAAQLSRIENGKRGIPKPPTIERIAKALKIDYEELMIKAGYIEEPLKPQPVRPDFEITDDIFNSPKVLYGNGLRESREKYGLTDSEVAEKTGIPPKVYMNYENDEIPSPEHGIILQKFFNALNKKKEKEEKDIAKRMAQLSTDLKNAEGLAFDGEPMSDEARESLLEALEFGVRLAKKNNKKYTPKKYRDNE